jgi:nucleoside-diphosphate kinase
MMEMMVEKTLVLIKPDAVQRGLVGEIIKRLEARGLKISAMKSLMVSQELAEKHYAVHLGKPFYDGLIKYIVSAPVVAMVWEGPNAIKAVRQTMGATNPLEAAPGSIRHDYALNIGRNLTHGSDSLETAEKEIALWFAPGELMQWERVTDKWIFENN